MPTMREFASGKQAEPQTVREQLVTALEHNAEERHHYADHEADGMGPAWQECEYGYCHEASVAIERANREPEEPHDLDTCIENAREAGRL